MSDIDPRLRAALRALPAATARPGFAARVLRRIDEIETVSRVAAPAGTHRRALRPAWASALAAALLLVAGAGGVVVTRHVAREQRRADLRRESEELRRELSALREEAHRAQPALYLGGSEQVDVVLDLDAMPVAAAARVGSRPPTPASHQEEP